jgi:hypothetical protein
MRKQKQTWSGDFFFGEAIAGTWTITEMGIQASGVYAQSSHY